MRQGYRAQLSKWGGNALIGVCVAAYVAFRIAIFIVFVLGLWYVSEPVRVFVAWLWDFIPPGARGETGVGLAIAGGVLLLGFVVLCFKVKDEPVRRRHGGGGQFSFGVDADVMDYD